MDEGETSTDDLLRAAEEKLERLQEQDNAPKSWADLGLPPEPEPPPAVPAVLQWAPLAVGGFALGLFALNAIGVFGEGPDLDAWVNEMSEVDAPAAAPLQPPPPQPAEYSYALEGYE